MNPSLPILRDAVFWLAALVLGTAWVGGLGLAGEVLVMGSLCVLSLGSQRALSLRVFTRVLEGQSPGFWGWVMFHKTVLTVALVCFATTQLSVVAVLIGWLPLVLTTLTSGLRLLWRAPFQPHSVEA